MDGPARYTMAPNFIPNRSLDSVLASESRISAWQDRGDFRRTKTGVVLDGNTDSRYRHTITTAEVADLSFTIPFRHDLDFIPSVTGSFYNSIDNKRHDLPFLYHSYGDSYFGIPPSALICVDSVDETYITVGVVIYDALGLSVILANNDLVFKFYCRLEATA